MRYEKENMLYINFINIEAIDSETYQLFRSVVSENRRKKADRFVFMEDAKRCICAELLLEYSLFQMFNQMISINLCYNENGKPSLEHVEGFLYNISHSGKWVVIAYGDNEVGIDIERIPVKNTDIVDDFFSDEEKKYIHSGKNDEQIRRFIEIWTLKESYLKYLGTGLSKKLNSFSVNPVDHNISDENKKIDPLLKLKSYLFDLDYYLAICTTEKEVSIYEVGLEDMLDFVKGL